MGAPTVTKTVTETVESGAYLTVTLAAVSRVYAYAEGDTFWYPAKVKYYSGAAWVQKPLKVYDGANWIRIA